VAKSATWPARNGLVRRILVTSANPRTDRQVAVRDLLSQQARRFDALTDAQQDAWNVAAAGYQSSPRLGQSGPLTGLQLFIRVNCKLGLPGQDQVDAPPAAPQFLKLAPQNLVISMKPYNPTPSFRMASGLGCRFAFAFFRGGLVSHRA
jgi:hypothetical protein